ncbi:MarR family winged helix-turn-helix transcriptional regulator [Diaphorobacter caeni]|uniref:MarR family winged helix-turn-helix transcriptional regulator n=1 Tax=Diaphorobacter caeni TaxID=2784387 RepID=UPI00188EB467|nr:MarR family transcriptional regulator [Diaphorobacter caeni]MBF5007012.1 MarR family transcriptional regulator [Diaphorobacter caeni]
MNSNDYATPRRRVGFRLVGLARRWRQALDTRLASAGLSDAVWAPLIHLYRLGDGVSQSELASAVGIDGSSLVRLLDMLVAQELVERQPHPTDRRIKLLNLTPKGRTTVQAIRKRLVVLEDELLVGLDDATLETLLNAFDVIDQRIAALHDKS